MPLSANPPKQPYAIIIGLQSLAGLQAARILAARDVPVIGVTSDPTAFCARTNVCERIMVADTETDEFIRTLEELGPTLTDKAVLFPCTDMSVLHISRSRDRLAGWYHISLPAAEVVEKLIDKISFYSYAQEAGLPIPKTKFLYSRADAEEAAEQFTFPCILKPPMKSPEWLRNATEGVYKIADAAEFLSFYDHCSGWAPVLMLQELVTGPDANLYSCNCYFNAQSEPIVTFIARKIRQWPPGAGVSSLGEECRNDIVLEQSVRLFRSVGYRGLGYVEIKRDERTNNYYIIEPNIGRPTGRSAIAEAGGVELLYAMYCDMVGWPLPPNLEQKYGNAKWIYWRRDLQAALYYWRRGELSLKDWLQSWRGRKRCAVFSWTDPVPFFADLIRVAGFVIRRNKAKGAAEPLTALKASNFSFDKKRT